MRKFLKILTLIWLALFLFIGVSMLLDTPEQIKSDKEFVITKIQPSVAFIKNFKTIYKRLPTNREYYTWQRDYHNDYSSDLNQKEDSLIPGMSSIQYVRNLSTITMEDKEKLNGANWEKDYAIAVWRGDWWEYYYSWTDNYDTNDYSWKDGFTGLLILIIIGCIPLLFWWIKKKKVVHNDG
jgi:hypothetical protein